MGDEIITGNPETIENPPAEEPIDTMADDLAKKLGVDALEDDDNDNNEDKEVSSDENQKQEENLLAGKFKDEKALEEGYKNLESQFTETVQKLSAIEKMFAHDENGNIITDETGSPVVAQTKDNQGQETPPENPKEEPVISDEELTAIQEKFEENPAEAMKEMTAKIAERLVETKLQEKLSPIMTRIAEEDEAKIQEKINIQLAEMEKIPDFIEHKEEISQIFDKYPHVAETENPYETAYKIYIADNLDKYLATAQQKGVSAALKNIKAVEESAPAKGVPTTTESGKTSLTDEEKIVARNLGLTEEEFLEELKNSKEVMQ